MRLFQRALATTVAGLAFAAAGVVGAAPALASPEDGEGCVGTPAVPASYVCVISLTPEAALPTVTPGSIPVTVPSLCYFLDCTDETTVAVPTRSVSPNEGVVAVLWYKGQYTPIAVGTGQATTLLSDTLDLAVETATGAVATATAIANGVVSDLDDVIDGLPSVTEVHELVTARVQQIADDLQPTIDRVSDIVDGLPTVEDVEAIVDRELGELLQRIDDVREDVQRIVDSLPTLAELRDAVNRVLADLLERIEPLEDEVRRILATLDPK